MSTVFFKIVGAFEVDVYVSNCGLCLKCFWNSFYKNAFSTIPLLKVFLELLFYYYNTVIVVVKHSIPLKSYTQL